MSRLAKLANRYRKQYPHLPFSVRREEVDKGCFAYCQKVGEKFLIAIDKQLPEAFAIFLLPHELAHAIAYHEEDEHGDQFWAAYRINYRIYEQFCKG
jgi:Zn-dependent peptidase ImmA (M78 family)